MKRNNISEQELIQELKNGSQQAFNRIYYMYARRLYAFCLQYTKLREDAEEIVQDVFVQLWKSRETIRQDETLRPLLFKIAHNSLINAYKSTLNSPIYEDYVNYTDTLADDDNYHRLEYKEFVEQVKKVMSRLPETQRKVIELSRFEGLTNAEVAERLSLSMQTVKNQLSLGLKALKAMLAKIAPLCYCLLIISSLRY
ncbi:MAG: RNA polymerase sigma-70 factor [Tannerella sp.]|nr:RNA polymerase sigma-70 factor [Tannerella sp.]